MTAFASARGDTAPWNWVWEMRSVNARGLDLRLRVPDWLEGLEAGARADLSKALTRGSVTVSLRIGRDDVAQPMAINEASLDAVLTALEEVENRAMARGITLAPSRASDLLQHRGVLEAGSGDEDTAPLVAALRKQLGEVLNDFLTMRRREGEALATILSDQLTQVETLTEQAAETALARKDAVRQTLQDNLALILDGTGEADADRVAQELALLAVKADVTEEIDRLKAHVAAARDLLATGGAVGRKLDFLMQEFNREANTLCSKAQNRDLTAIGLELKAVIDQMREQVQNVE
ncbi:MAG: YicC/YloC family endoribonuclease [Paracoccaceae bacterium]